MSDSSLLFFVKKAKSFNKKEFIFFSLKKIVLATERKLQQEMHFKSRAHFCWKKSSPTKVDGRLNENLSLLCFGEYNVTATEKTQK